MKDNNKYPWNNEKDWKEVLKDIKNLDLSDAKELSPEEQIESDAEQGYFNQDDSED